MRSRILYSLPVSLTPLVALAAMLPSSGQMNRSTDASGFNKTTQTFFSKHCTSCHNAKSKSGGLDLQSVLSTDHVLKHRETWESVLRKIRTGEMPPKGSPRPEDTEVNSVTHTIELEFDRVDRLSPTNPGRVTARRLNRTESNNTVRDLLGVRYAPANDSPQDDSGYGFDNIGDVLSLSPSQMERYVSAAEKIARTAVFGSEALSPTIVRLEAGPRTIVPTVAVPMHYDA